MRLEAVLARVLDEPVDSFTEDSSPDNMWKWTSLRNVTLLIEIENEFDIRFSNTEMSTIRTLGDIRAALAKKGVAVG